MERLYLFLCVLSIVYGLFNKCTDTCILTARDTCREIQSKEIFRMMTIFESFDN
jgi:hypothetical protein